MYIRVFYPVAPSYRQKELSAIYKLHENDKKICYGQRVGEVEIASISLTIGGGSSSALRGWTNYIGIIALSPYTHFVTDR